MRVLNIHKRTLNQPKSKVTELLRTLSTENDRIWPKEKWPEMKFKNGIQVGAKGGHGPIRYSVEKYNPNEIIQFRFSKPNGFSGIHKFEVIELDKEKTEIKHTIEMNTTGKGTLIWTFAIRSLHNALIEDGFDKLENNFSENRKSTEWSLWVKFLRKQIAKKRRK
ncbi:MAG: hypothetical protein HRT58_20655 [Crocinitomicaceae bacterium]|nr:hypothetical protein [Crocinitomicaceae bacterium]